MPYPRHLRGVPPIDAFIETVLQFIQAQAAWAAPIVFLLAFAESLAFISLLVPATALLLGISAALAAGGIPFWPVWAGAVGGAILGDALSFWCGWHFKERVMLIWPLSKQPGLLERGRRFFLRYGFWGVFVGRFFGPLRAGVPLAAGVCGMHGMLFQLANVSSALIWATLMLAPGTFAVAWLR